MKKREKNLLILGICLVLLVGAFFLWKHLSGDEPEVTEEPPAETFAVPAPLADKVTKVDLTVRHPAEPAPGTDPESADTPIVGETVTHLVLEKDAAGSWHWTGSPDVPIDPDSVLLLASSFDGMTTQHRLTAVSAEKLAEYGLSDPTVVAVFGQSDGASRELRIGIRNSFNGLYYLADAADLTTVYLVDSYAVEALDVSVLDLILTDSLPAIGEGNFVSVTCETGSDTLVYTYYPAGNAADYTDAYHWYLSVNGQKEIAVGSDMAASLENVLMYGYLNGCVSYNADDAASFGLDAPKKITVAYKKAGTVTDSSTGASTTVLTPASYTLLFGSLTGDGEYYVRTEGSPLTYTVAYSGTYEKLFDADPAVIRPAELAAINPDFLTGATITVGSDQIREIITHTASETTYRDEAGVLLYADDFTSILDKLASLRAVSNTAYFEAEGQGQTAAGDEMVSFDFTFEGVGVTSARLTVTRYNDSYCRVSFLDREDQLITNADAQSLCDVISAFFHG